MAHRASLVATGDRHKGILSPFTPSHVKHQGIAKRWCFGHPSFVALFVILSWGVSNGRPAPQQSVPTFRTSTELVSVPVTVKDRHGNRVHGLTRDDFHISEDGRDVAIRSFTSVPLQPASAESSSAPAHLQVSLPPEIAGIPIILFFDQLNTPSNE